MIHQWIASFIINSLNIIWGCLFVGQLDIDVSVERNQAGIVLKPVLVWSQSYSNESILRVCSWKSFCSFYPSFGCELFFLCSLFSSCCVLTVPLVFFSFFTLPFHFSFQGLPPAPLLPSLCKQANKQLPLVPGWLSVVPPPSAQRTPWQTHRRKPIHMIPNISEFCWESMLTNDQAWNNTALIMPIDLHWSDHAYHCMTVKLDLVTYAVIIARRKTSP